MLLNDKDYKLLEKFSAQIRLSLLDMFLEVGSGHLGGSYSIVELLTVIYHNYMHIDPNNPNLEDRDRLVLSKGHAGPALYATLAHLGFFDSELLLTLNKGGTQLPSHADRLKTPGIDVTTGSLGQGTSVAAGLAMGFKLLGKDNYVYLIVGDGELNEGQCWEAFQFIAHHNLHQCIVIIDDNKKQLDGYTSDIIDPINLLAKMTSFGFSTLKVKGSDLIAIDAALQLAHNTLDQPTCIILDSIKGQGIDYFENMQDNHSVKFNNKEILDAVTLAQQELKGILEGESI